MADDREPDVRQVNRVALFWRELLGEEGFHKFDSKALWDWYQALELRGPDDIRHYVTERSGSTPLREVRGIVAKAPHPPMRVVELWLRWHETRRTQIPMLRVVLLPLLLLIILSVIKACHFDSTLAPPALVAKPPVQNPGAGNPTGPGPVQNTLAQPGSFAHFLLTPQTMRGSMLPTINAPRLNLVPMPQGKIGGSTPGGGTVPGEGATPTAPSGAIHP